MRRRIMMVLGAALLGVGGWYGWRTLAANTSIVGVGSMAPDFAAMTLGPDAAPVGIADYRGDVVLINLWATWCHPCVVEMPSIQRLYDRFKDRGLRVVGVAVDDPPFADAVRDFIASGSFTYEFVHEGSGRIESDYRAIGIPSTYLVGRDGRIRMAVQGATDWDAPAVRAVVDRLLSDGEAPSPGS